MSATPTSGSAVDLGTPVLSDTENLHHGMVRLDWEDVEDAGWYVVQYYHVQGGEWLDLPAVGVDIAFHGSSAVVSNLHGLSWLRVRAMSCAGASEWSQIEQLFGTKESDWEDVPVPEVEEGDEIEPCRVVLGTPVLSDTETLHHGLVQLDWEDIEDAGWYVVQYYHVKGGEWLDLPAEGVDIAFHGSSAVVSNLHGLSWLRVGAMSCAGESEWSQIEQWFGTNESDWEGVPVPEVAEGDETEPCDEDADTSDNSPATGLPTISGTAQVGETLTADTSGIADADGLGSVQYEYQWLSDDSDISGATKATYTLTDSEESKAITVRVSFTDDAGNDESLTSEPTAVVSAALPPPDNVRAIAQKSGAVELTWDAPQDATVIGYRIERRPAGGSPRDNHTLVEDTGSADTSYTDNTAQKGVGYEYRVSARNEAGAGEESDWVNAEEATASNSPATGAPTISGTAQVGETLTADTSGIADADGLANATFSYQWLADDTDIAGATGLTYTLTDSEESKAITVRVSFTDDADNEETLTSAATAAVAAKPNSPATGEPGLSFSWMTRVGETITAETSGIADADGLTNATFSYQWLADDVEIAGATGLTYTLVAADEGKAISVRVGFTDDAGHEETLTSWATGAVVAANVGLVVNTVIAEPVREGSYARVSFSVTRFTVGKKYSLSFGGVWIADNSAFFFVEPMSICGARGLSFPMDILVDSSDTVITHEGLISDRCPAGDYKLVVSWRTEDGEEEGRHLTSFQVLEDDTEVDEYSSQYVDYITPEYPDPPAEHGPFLIGLLSTAGPEWGSVIYDWGIAGVVPDSDPDTLDYVVSLRVVDDDNNPVANCNEDGVGGSYKLYTIPEDRGWGREVTLSARCMSGAGSATFTIEFLNGSSELLLRAESPLGAARPNGDEADTPDGDDENAPLGVVINTVIAEPVQEGVGANVSVSVTGFAVGESYELRFGNVIPANVCSVNSFDPIPVDLAGYGWIIHVDSSDYVWTKEGFISPTCPAGTYSWEVHYRRLNSFEIGMSASLFTVVAALPNSPATGTPTISGTAQVGETLTANTSGVIDADGLSSVQYEHQWLADDTEIAGATNATYTLVAADEGKVIKVRVSFTDDADNEETLTSAATAAVAAEPTPNSAATGAPTITGTAQVGETLTADASGIADADGLANATFSYQWLADDTDIAGASGLTYTLTDSEESKAITVQVIFTDDADNEETLTSTATDAVSAALAANSPATGAPTITGTVQVGETLTADMSGIADDDGLNNVQYEYQWLADDSEIAGATSLTYTLADADEGKAIKVEVSFTDDVGNDETLTSTATDAVAAALPPPDNLRAVTQKSGAVELTWDAPQDATVTGYRIERRPTGGSPSDQQRSDGSPRDNHTLVEDTGSADTSYTDNTAQEGVGYEYRVSARNEAGAGAESDWVNAEEATAPNSPATGALTISGTAQVGETLTADTSGVADADGLGNVQYEYQWLADDTEIAGVTNSTYTVAAADEGKAIKVRVSFTDDAGNQETLTSAATDAVTAAPPSITPGEPQNLELTPVAVGTTGVGIKVFWDTPSATGGSDISGYRIEWKGGNQDYPDDQETRQAFVENAPYTIDTTSPTPIEGDELTVRVTAVNGAGAGVWTERTGWLPSHTDLELWLLMKEYADEKQTTFPWVLETWNYLDRHEVPVEVNPNSRSSYHSRPCVRSYTDGDDGLKECHTEKIIIRQIEDPNPHAIIHEMAHAYTLANRVTETPEPLAIAHLYFENLGLGCRVHEVYADVLTLLTLGTSYSSYWGPCNGSNEDRQAQAFDVVRSAVNGEMPQWFADTYTDSEGEVDLESLWTDVQDWPSRPTVVVYQLRNAFGGYCNNELTWMSMEYSDETLTQPWIDGGCPPAEPSSLEVTPGSGELALAWDAPDSDGDSDVEGYIVRWRSGNQTYYGPSATQRRAVLDSPTSLAYTIPGLTHRVQYDVQVQAYNAIGAGYPSGIQSVTPKEAATPQNTPATGAPYIDGATAVGQTLTAVISGISDADGLTNANFAYQWLADDSAIAGATSLTYTLIEADEGKTITVQVTFTDDAGNDESMTSAPTDATGAAGTANIPATGAPIISGTPRVGEVLTVDASGISDEDGIENTRFTFSWSTGTYNIASEPATEYTIQPADEGKKVDVTAIFKDDKDNLEILYSAPTSVVEAKTNSPATGTPSISGTTEVGETLTANITGIADEDGLSTVQYAYQWWADGTAIAGATSLTYTLAEADEGKAIKVEITFTDDAGNDESLTSAATAAVAAALEPPDRPNRLNGTATHDSVTLTWDDPSDDSITGYVILRRIPGVDPQGHFDELVPNTGTAATTYTDNTVASETRYTYRIKAINSAGKSERSRWFHINVPAAPAPDPGNSPATGTPTISGTVQVGETLTANTSGIADADGLGNVQYEYRWLADDAEIVGATNATYTLGAADEGKAIKVEVSFTDDAGNEETLTSVATEAVAAAPTPNSPATGAPTITGTAQVGETLTADTSGIADANGLSNVQYEYQWLADDSDISGATNATYTLVAADEAKAIKVQVSFTDDADNEESLTSVATNAVAAAPQTNSPATGAPSISGTAQVGETLTADTAGIEDADGLTNISFTYQWMADDADISGATGSTYTLADSEEGKAIKVEVSFTDDAGNDESLTSAATDEVDVRPNSPATGAPTISGTAQVGETLTANTSGIADADGLANATFSYQWLEDEAEIAGATSSTYTLAAADEGKAVKVEVSFTDDAGNDESLTSAATEAVAAAGPAEPPAKPRNLSATATHDQVVLTWDDPQDDSVTGYVVLRRVRVNNEGGEFSELVADTGTAAATYTDNTVAASTTYTYRIKAINGAGTSERSRWVHIDIPAAPVPDKPTGLSATATHDSITLTWDDPGDDSITGYVVLRRNRDDDPKGHFDELVADTGTAATTHTDDTVAAGTSYTYRIKAINGAGPGERSRWYHIDTPAAP